MKTAFTYHRYSDDKQAQGYTLESQRNITKSIAEKHDAQIIGIYEDEGISGANIDKRPAMLNMLVDMANLKPDYIICTDQDRISRGNDFWYIKNEMAKHGTCFITDKDGIINFSQDTSKDLMSDILAATSKFYIGLLRTKVKRGNVTRAQNGLFIGNLTNVYGYDYDKQTKNLIINEKEAEVVKMIFDLYLHGHGFYKISRILNMQEYKTKKGSNFVSSNINRILSHTLYYGYICHLGQIYKGIHEPIISEETFLKAQSQHRENENRNPRMNIKHLLTGFLFCGTCNSRLQATNGEKGLRQKEKSRSYACSGYFKMICNKPAYIKLRLIEPYVIDEITKKLESLDLKIRKPKNTVKNINKNISEQVINDKLVRLNEQYVEGNIGKLQYDTLNIKYKKELEKIKETKKIPEKNNIDYSYLANIKIEDLVNNLNFEELRKVISILVDKIIIYNSNGKKVKDLSLKVKIIWNKDI